MDAGGRSEGSPALSRVPFEGLRTERAAARRMLELARMRLREPSGPDADEIDVLRARVDALTEELIGRYAADLGLVESLLDEPYPRRMSGTRVGATGRRGTS